MCSKVLNGHIILTDTSITTILAPEMTYTPFLFGFGVFNGISRNTEFSVKRVGLCRSRILEFCRPKGWGLCRSRILEFCRPRGVGLCRSRILEFCQPRGWGFADHEFWGFVSLELWSFAGHEFWSFVGQEGWGFCRLAWSSSTKRCIFSSGIPPIKAVMSEAWFLLSISFWIRKPMR